MDGVLRLIGRFSTAHACPYGDGRYALTAAHVIDPRPFDLSVPAFAVRWSDGDGHSGVAEPVVIFRSSDLAVIEREDRQPFSRAYPLARAKPFSGDKVFILAYDQDSKVAALSPHLVEGSVLRVVADNLILDENSKPGSSGGCVLNDKGEIVGIVAWGRAAMTKFPKARAYPLAVEAVENGARYAVAKLWKYDEPPPRWSDADEERLRALIVQAVLSELCERFEFD